MSEAKRYGDPVFGNTLQDLKVLATMTQTTDGLKFEGPARKVEAFLTLAAAAGELIGDIEDLELALQYTEGRAESAGRSASAFEDRMGDLQVENGKLRDRIAELEGELQRRREAHRTTWTQLEQARLREPATSASTPDRYCTGLTYTTQAGESLMGIALRELGSNDRWVEIRDLNAEAFPDMGPHDYYPVGTVVRLPWGVQVRSR